MSATSNEGVKASSVIPDLYRIPLLYLEPFFAFNGAMLALFIPENYVTNLTRGAVTSLDSSTNFIYTELAGAWLYFAFTEAVVLRLVDRVSVWRLLCLGMLLSDILYCHSCAQAVGGWNEWLIILNWTREDWTVTITTWPFVLSRLAIVLGIGFKNVEDVAKDD